jgi:hypothetical protein
MDPGNGGTSQYYDSANIQPTEEIKKAAIPIKGMTAKDGAREGALLGFPRLYHL